MSNSTQTEQPQYPHGYFADPETGFPIAGIAVHTSWCVDGTRDMMLDYPVLYVDPLGRQHRVPVEFRTNGLTVPRIFWRIVQPYEPIARDASVIHDWCCFSEMDWIDAAWVFYQAMRCRGVSRLSAWLRWAAVR